MNDDLLRPPPERDVSLQLRARVLGAAVDPATPVRGPRRLLTPVLAGLTAAAVVVGVITFLDQGSSGPMQPSGGSSPVVTHGTVGVYQPVEVDLRALHQAETSETRASCQHRRTPTHKAKLVLAKRLQLSPMTGVDIPVLAYARGDQTNVYLCSPYEVTHLRSIATFLPTSNPVEPLEDSHFKAMVAASAGGPTDTYVDGAWFNVNQSVARIEVRINIGSDAGRWFSTKRNSDIMFASGWRTLTDAQIMSPVQVEYRAVTVDDEVIRLDSLGGTVTPADQSVITPVLVPDVPR